jgi:hypothetical protein
VFLKQRPILLLERHLAMMLFLIADIFRHDCSIRNTHTERAKSFLPGEAASVFVHPFGRVRFEKLNGLGQRNGWRQVKKNMRVIRHAVDGDRGHFLIAADACQVGPEFRLDIFGYGGLTIFCAEYEMNMIFDERMRHGMPPFQGFDSKLLHFPALTHPSEPKSGSPGARSRWAQ